MARVSAGPAEGQQAAGVLRQAGEACGAGWQGGTFGLGRQFLHLGFITAQRGERRVGELSSCVPQRLASLGR